MRERLAALKAEWEKGGACAFPWDELTAIIESSDCRAELVAVKAELDAKLQELAARLDAMAPKKK